MRFRHVTLSAAAGRLSALADFYAGDLGMQISASGADRLSLRVGETVVELVAGAGQPFYHFALLVPGNRFDAAREWANARTTPLQDLDTGETVFDFANWHAQACYFHDPAGNIVELIAHRGIDETDAGRGFRPRELVGVSEVGLVGDPRGMAARLERVGLELWDGTVEEPGRLAFVGEQARTLIITPPGRGWLPTGRAAEPHPVGAVVEHRRDGEVELEGSRYRISAIVEGGSRT